MSLPEDPTPTLQELQSSISHLSSVLDPVLSQKLSALSQQLESGSSQSANAPGVSTTGAASASDGAVTTRELAGRLDSARLNVSAAYVLLDLIWSELFSHSMYAPCASSQIETNACFRSHTVSMTDLRCLAR